CFCQTVILWRAFHDDRVQGTLGQVSALVASEPNLDYAVLPLTATDKRESERRREWDWDRGCKKFGSEKARGGGWQTNREDPGSQSFGGTKRDRRMAETGPAHLSNWAHDHTLNLRSTN